MSKKYFLTPENSDDTVEVEVLHEDDQDFVLTDFNNSTIQFFSDYLAANNLQLIKTVK